MILINLILISDYAVYLLPDLRDKESVISLRCPVDAYQSPLIYKLSSNALRKGSTLNHPLIFYWHIRRSRRPGLSQTPLYSFCPTTSSLCHDPRWLPQHAEGDLTLLSCEPIG